MSEMPLISCVWVAKIARLQKGGRAVDDLVVTHDERMRDRDNEEIRHTVRLGSLHRDFAIVVIWQHGGHEGVDCARPGDYSELEIDGK